MHQGNPKMEERTQMPWHEAYRQLSAALYEFYKKNKDKTGVVLYEACKLESGFMAENKWLANYETVYDVRSMDPVQIFASFTASKMKPKNRQKRLNEFLVLLGQQPIKTPINYDGCPAPNPVMLLNSRREIDHHIIWQLFAAAFTRGQQDKIKLTPELFNGFPEWYGIQITSLTIFLFWVNSGSFLSLDGNTLDLLVLAEKVEGRPGNFQGYTKLLEKENTEVYRNLALLAVDQLDVVQLDDHQKHDLIEYLGKKGEDLLFPSQTEGEKANGDDKVPQSEKPPQDQRSDDPEKAKQREDLADAIRQTRFQLLAIRPLEMKDELLKTLSPGDFYHFYKQYTFSEENGRLHVAYNPEADLTIYDAKPEDEASQPKISISAIVGKNGAGKSNLVELLIMAINNIAGQYFRHKHPNGTHNVDPVPGLKMELYFKLGPTTIYQVQIDGKDVDVFLLRLSEQFEGEVNDYWGVDVPSAVLFYSTVANYSLHGLRSNDKEKPWLSKLFNKNDAYQVPIVLTPWRDNGTINISSLFGQVKSRLVVNLLEYLGLNLAGNDEEKEEMLSKSFRQLTDTQRAEQLQFQLKAKDDAIPKRYVDETAKLDFLFKKIKQSPEELFTKIQEAFIEQLPSLSRKLREMIPFYLQKKLVTMCLSYPQYESFFDSKTLQFNNLSDLFEKIKEDSSHVTYKFKRVINFLQFELYPRKDHITYGIEELSILINKVLQNNPHLSIETFIPPSFYTPVVELRTQGAPETAPLISFQRLSSGEKQRIYAVSSLIYHLRNLNSVKSSKNIHKYSNVNVIFDEVELYFHPEWQRTYIDYMLRMLHRVDLQEISSINICFVTHSPFILSDIPSSNILFLDKESITEGKTQAIPAPVPTFAANIHELLIDGFFMDHTVGEFARKRIENILKFYNEFGQTPIDAQNQRQRTSVRQGLREHKKIVRMIGEDYIRGILENHMEEVEKNWFTTSYRQSKIDRLREELEREEKLQASENTMDDHQPPLI